jgi:signal transduction histidine kinase/putative methionine-R-sulfoxide reductase with GAF domain
MGKHNHYHKWGLSHIILLSAVILLIYPEAEMLDPLTHNLLILLAGLWLLGVFVLLYHRFSSMRLQTTSPDRSRGRVAIKASGGQCEHPQPPHLVINQNDNPRRRYTDQLLTLNRIATELVQIHDINQLYQSLLEASEELLRSDASGIYLLAPDGMTIEQASTHNLSDEYSQNVMNNFHDMPWETALKTLKLVKVENVLEDVDYGDRIHFMADYNLRAMLILPIFYHKLTIGVLVVYFHQPHSFIENELQLGEMLAITLAMAIQNARLYQSEHSQREMAEALTQAANALNSTLNLEEVLDTLLEQTLRVVSCKSLNVMLIEGDKIVVVRRKGYEHLPEHTKRFGEYRFPLSTPTFQTMFTTGQPILISDTRQSELWDPVKGTEWILSFAAAPLNIGDQIIGFLNVDSDQPGYFDSETPLRLQAFATHAALAIHNAKQYEESRRQAEDLASLARAAAAIATSLDVNQVLKTVVLQISEQFSVDACALFSYDLAQNTVTTLVEYPADEAEKHPAWYMPISMSNYPATQKVLENGLPEQRHISDINLDPAEYGFMMREGIRSILTLPLIAHDQITGLAELYSREQEHHFSLSEINRGQMLSFFAATAIQNARLYQRTQEYATDLEVRVQGRTAELQSAKEHIEGILACVPEAVFVLDEANQLVQANQAGENLLMSAREQLIDLFAGKTPINLESGATPSEKAILEVQERAYQPLASRLTVSGQPAGLVLALRDVTHFRELDRMKNQFVSDVSHELRTPLTNLTIYTDLLANTKDLTKREEHLETLRRELGRLSHLIEDLLTISRLEAGRVEIHPQPIQINKLVADFVIDRAMMADSRGLILRCETAENLPAALGDVHLLNQAISNLLTNAINYTPSGGSICLKTALVQSSKNEAWVTVEVSDDGYGISAEEMEHIFERFYRGSASKLTKAPGTGLGLPISKEIVTRMGGKITMVSALQKGSTFTVWLRAQL